jgi:hypothetical protein
MPDQAYTLTTPAIDFTYVDNAVLECPLTYTYEIVGPEADIALTWDPISLTWIVFYD